MKLGSVVVIALVALSAVSALTLVEKPKEDPTLPILANLETYKNKLMYDEAISEYYNLINVSEASQRYPLIIELRDYCKEINYVEPYINACRAAVDANPSDTESAKAVLQYLRDTQNRELYNYVKSLIAIPPDSVSAEAHQYYVDYYDTIKGDYRLYSMRGIVSAGEWLYDKYTFAENTDGVKNLVFTDGTVTSLEGYEVDSYSVDDNLIAAVHENQHVYINIESKRKLVPYDLSKKELIYYDYLGPVSCNIANFRYSGNKWGYLDRNMNPMMTDLDAATPVYENFFAAKSQGKWHIYYINGGPVSVFECDELFVDNDFFINNVAIDAANKTKTICFYAKTGGGSAWTQIKAQLDFSGKELVINAAPVGSQSYEDVRLFGQGCGAVKSAGSWHFVDINGSAIDAMGSYEDARSMTQGLAAVRKSGTNLWGYIDINGKQVIEPSFEEAYPISSNGTAMIYFAGSWNLIKLLEYNN